jgi:TetR/AcrR family transcriptional regulator
MEKKRQPEDRAARIKEAAKRLFIDKGYDGTTMQAIADAAKVNKALLHYYFKSKDKLFLIIFRGELAELSDFLSTIWQEGEGSLRDRLEDWIDSQTAFLARAPRLPLFIITEMTRHPELIKELFSEFLPPIQLLHPAGKKDASAGESGLPALVELVGIVYSLVFFPAVAGPLIQQLLGIDSPILDELMASQARLAKELLRRRLDG